MEESKQVEDEIIEEEVTEEEGEDQLEVESLSRDELNVHLLTLTRGEDSFSKDDVIQEIIDKLQEIYSEEEKSAFDKFIKDGGEKDGFEYRDEDYEDFKKLVSSYNKSKKNYFSNLNKTKSENLAKKEALLEDLRDICDGNKPSGLSAVRKIQDQWKAAEPIPTGGGSELWANYKALLDRYFNNRHVNSQLKELDRKKNQEVKEELCFKAEQLIKEKSFNKAIERLNELHQEYKETGPVPEELSDSIWERFKTASDKIYELKREHLAQMKEQFAKNEIVKREIIEQMTNFSTFQSESIQEWKQTTEKVVQLQEDWKQSGGVGRKLAKELSKDFWAAGKLFFKNKSAFYQKQEGNYEENLQAKVALCEEVEGYLLLDEPESDLKNKFIQAQNRWKDIGPVSRKESDKVYKRFKKACDSFFDRQRQQRKEAFKVYEDNLKEKEKLCTAFEPTKIESVQQLKEFISAFEDGGEVPRKEAAKIGKKFFTLGTAGLESLKDLGNDEKEELKIKIKVVSLADDPKADRMIDGDRRRIRKEISDLENDISTWQTNIEFFARSKNAAQLRADIDKKVANAQQKVDKLKKNLKKINSLGR